MTLYILSILSGIGILLIIYLSIKIVHGKDESSSKNRYQKTTSLTRQYREGITRTKKQ